MASSSGRKTSSSKKSTASNKTSGRKRTSAKNNTREIDEYQAERDSEMFREISLIVLFIAAVFLFCCNFGIIGGAGDAISGVLFGLFGFSAYIVPPLLFLSVAFWFANEGSPTAVRKLAAGIALFVMFGVVCDLLAKGAVSLDEYDAGSVYALCSEGKKGGGVIAGSLAYLLKSYLEVFGTILVVLLCSVVSIILLTEKSLLGSMQSGKTLWRERKALDAEKRKEYADIRRQEQEEERIRREEERMRRAEERRRREEEKRLRIEEKENEKILRIEKKVTGVMMDTSLKNQEDRHTEDIHEITYNGEEDGGGNISFLETQTPESFRQQPVFDFEKIQIRSAHQVTLSEEEAQDTQNGNPQIAGAQFAGGSAYKEDKSGDISEIRIHREDIPEQKNFILDDSELEPYKVPEEAASLVSDNEEEKPPQNTKRGVVNLSDYREEHTNSRNENLQNSGTKSQNAEPTNKEKKVPAKYMFPPLSRLNKGKAAAGDSAKELKETAMRLQQTLNNFGVKVTVTDISQGPSVTRYELQPEQGVKVSKIVGLSDDIKLNLAATDIRIEAPIPGKAAVGIEVPNKENMMVALRDLLESKEFQEFPSKIAFAVGKDIAGKIVVADIAKMPHMLIAGATGSGKSVCINTLIMSILYKAHPDDVKLIMVDPKVVELSVYNGIPHLLIPVVTDPKKASAALHWGVTEMEDRYRKFADFNVRDLKGYNEKVENMRQGGDETAPAKLPQIVIIVDELADLMMVCPGEVEESICRLAQLARAAGIHLIIATQRPSVDVITGLIKANMPSRVAFSVSSGVDSRTILDMNGAEKLLGKGDMLFYPQGYTKPARVQGAFVSDGEVSSVVDFLKNQSLGNTYAEDVEEKLKNISVSSGAPGAGGDGDSRDEYFAEAGRFIIDKDKASIGMLQRVLKIGFNRAARIMDQLCDYGVVGEEEGTKPRKVLMSMEQFEQMLEEIV
ncbi:MAG: DNA translocase FtsK [Bacteroidales bacterium]|nr:DNA translocase FtsK [Lachnoclostridium sp.]MCM1383028.1 DNA translocase FtsK [Lachnoclostridium sp.]MCM1463917.1 DNA translocase FtsK [Bacteroidales bacterium]